MEKKKVTGTKKQGNKASKRSASKNTKFDKKAPGFDKKASGSSYGRKNDAPFKKKPRIITDSATYYVCKTPQETEKVRQRKKSS